MSHQQDFSSSLSVGRRELLQLAAVGLATRCGMPWFEALSAQAATAPSAARPKSCILIWFVGGPPHTFTFDPKKQTPFAAIDTAVPGVKLSEHLPKMAGVMKDVTLLRGMKTSDSNHTSARYLMHTGFRKGQNGVMHPVLGSIVARQLGDTNNELPNFISVGSAQFGGFGAGHLGPKFSPIRVDNVSEGLHDLQPVGSIREFDSRRQLLDDLNAGFVSEHHQASALAHQVTLERASRLMHTPKTKAFDISAEKANVRATYGSSKLGDQFLLARRLIETGVKFVEIRQNGWDVHKDTVAQTKKLSLEFDTPYSALLTDLKQRGLLDSTLVIAMGEFGRNPENGSSHYSRAWTTVLAGGGLKHGQAIGDTGKKGDAVETQPISPGDFLATVCQALKIDTASDWETTSGRPVPVVSKGSKPISELF